MYHEICSREIISKPLRRPKCQPVWMLISFRGQTETGLGPEWGRSWETPWEEKTLADTEKQGKLLRKTSIQQQSSWKAEEKGWGPREGVRAASVDLGEAGPAAPSGVVRWAICPVHLGPSTTASVIKGEQKKITFSLLFFNLIHLPLFAATHSLAKFSFSEIST